MDGDKIMRWQRRGQHILIFSLIFCLIFLNFIQVNTKAEVEEDPLVPGWSKDIRLTNDSNDSLHPSIAVDMYGCVHVVWQDHRDDLWGIYYKKSTDGDIIWSSDQRINALSNSGNTPSIIVDKNNIIHVVWSGATQQEPYNEIYYKNSTDGGNTWNEDVRLTYASDDSFTPKIVAHGNTLHVVWSDKRDGNFEIYYKRSIDGGNSWSEDVRLTNDSGDSKLPSLVVDLVGRLHIAWYDKRDDVYKIYYISSPDGGGVWDNEINVTGGHGITTLLASTPSILTDSSNNLYIIWADGPFRSEKIFCKKKIVMNGVWETEKKIVEDTPWAELPSAVIDSQDRLYLIWKDGRNWSEENTDTIHFKKSNPYGELWENDTRITFENKGCLGLILTIDRYNILHAGWFEQRDGNNEIYYKCTLNPVTEPPIIVSQSLNQTTCKPGRSVTVSGNAVYNDFVVPNANVSIKIVETGEEWNTTTDLNGDYSVPIIAPDTPGNYTIRVTVTSGNHTGWKIMRLTVEQESTNGGTTNGGTTNGVQQPSDEENKLGINFNYVIMIAGMIAVCIVIGVLLVKHRGKTAAKTMEKKTEKTTMGLRCPKCKKTFRVELKPKPFKVKCPYCGREGEIK